MKVLDKIRKWFYTPSPGPVLIFDWFAERRPVSYPLINIKPKRGNGGETFDKELKGLIEGEILVNLTERRIFQKLDGKIVEWGIVEEK